MDTMYTAERSRIRWFKLGWSFPRCALQSAVLAGWIDKAFSNGVRYVGYRSNAFKRRTMGYLSFLLLLSERSCMIRTCTSNSTFAVFTKRDHPFHAATSCL